MCECKECCGCCEDDFEEEEMTKEDVIDTTLEMIEDGECVKCSIESAFDYGYFLGKKDLARESRDFYQDVLEEEE